MAILPKWYITLNTTAILDQLQIPIISDIRKQKLMTSYQKWGSYGWTPDPNEKLRRAMSKEPLSKSEADKYVRKFFSNMTPVFDSIRSCKRVKKTDLEEAIEDFYNKKYKSCAMVLFSLIDAQLIRLQKRCSKLGRYRDVGEKAIRRARKRSGVDEHEEWLLLRLDYLNLFSCLEVLFANGNDFRKEPDVINRNYLVHGMMRRKVSRTSCIQLFLLYYNMLEMLDLLYSKYL